MKDKIIIIIALVFSIYISYTIGYTFGERHSTINLYDYGDFIISTNIISNSDIQKIQEGEMEKYKINTSLTNYYEK